MNSEKPSPQSQDDSSTGPLNDASRMAEAMTWVSRITTICGMFSLPPLGGVYVDGWLGTTPLFIVIGAALGFSAGMYSLLKMVQPA